MSGTASPQPIFSSMTSVMAAVVYWSTPIHRGSGTLVVAIRGSRDASAGVQRRSVGSRRFGVGFFSPDQAAGMESACSGGR